MLGQGERLDSKYIQIAYFLRVMIHLHAQEAGIRHKCVATSETAWYRAVQ